MTEANFDSDIPSLRRVLNDYRTIAIVGLSATWHRPSHFAAKYLIHHGYRVIPVTPAYEEVLGEKAYPTLADVPDPVDVVDCFRADRELPALAEQAVAIGAKLFWMQLGLRNQQAAKIAIDGGLEVIWDRCMKIEHARLFGGLNLVGVNTGVISSARPRTGAH
ncbi:MAG: CoA-binding protein [Pseudomonadota bacterium]